MVHVDKQKRPFEMFLPVFANNFNEARHVAERLCNSYDVEIIEMQNIEPTGTTRARVWVKVLTDNSYKAQLVANTALGEIDRFGRKTAY